MKNCVFQLNLQASKSSLRCHLANIFPGAEQTSLGSWTIQGWKRQGFHILLCHICPDTFTSSLLPPLLGSVIYLLDFIPSLVPASL